jgi:hypothetical protein
MYKIAQDGEQAPEGHRRAGPGTGAGHADGPGWTDRKSLRAVADAPDAARISFERTIHAVRHATRLRNAPESPGMRGD